MSFQGKKNVYVCETCQRQMVTVDRDDGVTPFTTACGCSKAAYMVSSMYRVDQDMPATHEWYRPSATEAARMSHGAQEHVRRGGLVLREIGASS